MNAASVSETASPRALHSSVISRIMLRITLSACADISLAIDAATVLQRTANRTLVRGRERLTQHIVYRCVAMETEVEVRPAARANFSCRDAAGK